VSEAEYGYLASLLRKAREDTREEEIVQGEADPGGADRAAEEGEPKGGEAGEWVSDPYGRLERGTR
jgi:hypothetical protein